MLKPDVYSFPNKPKHLSDFLVSQHSPVDAHHSETYVYQEYQQN